MWFLLLTGFLVLVAGVVGLFLELDSAATAAALISGAALCGLAAVLFSMASPRYVGTATLVAETLFDYTDAKARLAAMDMPDELRDPFRRMARGEAAAAYLEVVLRDVESTGQAGAGGAGTAAATASRSRRSTPSASPGTPSPGRGSRWPRPRRPARSGRRPPSPSPSRRRWSAPTRWSSPCRSAPGFPDPPGNRQGSVFGPLERDCPGSTALEPVPQNGGIPR